jgi:hypothetical protein
MEICDDVGYTADAQVGSVVISYNSVATTKCSSIEFSKGGDALNNNISDYGYVEYYENVPSTYNYFGTNSSYASTLVLGCFNTNNAPDSYKGGNVVIYAGGGNISLITTNSIIYMKGLVGIGTTNPNGYTLYVNGSNSRFSGSVGIGTDASGNIGDLKLRTMTASSTATFNGVTNVNNNLNITTTSSNAINISNSTSTSFANINFKNNNNINAYIGIGGTNTSTYTSNLYLQADNAIILNAKGNISNTSIPHVVIASNGCVGIGVNNPIIKLDVAGTYNSNVIGGYFRSSLGLTYTTLSGVAFTDICARFTGSILVTNNVISSSDYRIKTNIIDTNNYNSLGKILSIKPKIFNYKDIINNSKLNYGFIAQEIKEIIPEAVSVYNSIIPNIYSICECNKNTITISSNIELLKINDTIQIINEKEEKNNYNIIDISINENQITINENLEGSNCFVYGTEVNDFHILNKDFIYATSISAIQELYKLIQEQNIELDLIENQINNIKL